MQIDFGVLLSLAFVTFMDELDRSMATAGYDDFGPWHGYVLRALEAEPLSLRSLADRLEMSSPGALKIVETMLAGGYLERADDPTDRRVRLIQLSDRGSEALAAARRFHQQFEAELAEAVGPRRATSTRATLGAIVERGSARVPRLLRHP